MGVSTSEEVDLGTLSLRTLPRAMPLEPFLTQFCAQILGIFNFALYTNLLE